MNCIDSHEQIYFIYSSFVEKVCACLKLLGELFQRVVYKPSSHIESLQSPSKITVGGIKNAGNTCIFSVLLQEFAALPSYYDFFLSTSPVRRQGEAESEFLQRNILQARLRECIQKIRSGQTVTSEEMHPVALLALQLGWQHHEMTLLHRVLYRWAPTIFPMPPADPTSLHLFLLNLISDSPEIPLIVGLGKRTVTYQEAFENSSIMQSCHDVALCRLIHTEAQIKETVILPECIETQNRQYSLQLVHVFKDTGIGHVTIYRKMNDQWLCCDDANVYVVKALPFTNIYTAVYASQPKL